MVDLTKPVQTIDGRAVRILCTDRSFTNSNFIEKYGPLTSYCVVALVSDCIGRLGVEVIELYTKNGETACGHEPGSPHWKDKLVNV